MFMMSPRVLSRLLVSFFAVQTMWASAVEVRFEPVADGVYAYVGDIGGRTVANQGLNANLGLVVTSGGAILIDSGSTFQTARAIHEAVRRVTKQPVRWVINTGGQDHRWLGNGYFKAQGAELIAHAAAVPDMRSRGGDQLAALRTLLESAADGTELSFPSRLLQGSEARLELGGTVFEFRHRGGGHTPGDLMVWLPHVQVAFSGDIVYVDRLLSVLPVSSTRAWVEALNALAQWNPKRIVPGHGRITDSKTAKAQSHDYLQAMRSHMQRAVEQGIDVSEAVKSFNVKPFMNLANAAELNPGNASRTYLEVEREYFHEAVLNHRVNALAVFASNPFMGELLSHLDASVQHTLVAKHVLDLTALNVTELDKRLRTEFRL